MKCDKADCKGTCTPEAIYEAGRCYNDELLSEMPYRLKKCT